jgi:hypothetical protein
MVTNRRYFETRFHSMSAGAAAVAAAAEAASASGDIKRALVVAEVFRDITLPSIDSINVDFAPPSSVKEATLQVVKMYRIIDTQTRVQGELDIASTENGKLRLFYNGVLEKFRLKLNERMSRWVVEPTESSLTQLLYTQDRMKEWVAVAALGRDATPDAWIFEYELQTRRILERLGCPLPEDLKQAVWLESPSRSVKSPIDTIPAFQQIRTFLASSFLTNPIRVQHQIESGSRFIGSKWTRYPFLAVYGPQRIGKQLMIRNAVKQMAEQLRARYKAEYAKFVTRINDAPDADQFIQYTVIDCDILRNGGYHAADALAKQLRFWLEELSDYAHANDVKFQIKQQSSRRVGVVVLEGFDRLFTTDADLRKREEFESLTEDERKLFNSDDLNKTVSAFTNLPAVAPLVGGETQLEEAKRLGSPTHKRALEKELTVLLDPRGELMSKLSNMRVILECEQLWAIPSRLLQLVTMTPAAAVSSSESKGSTNTKPLSSPLQVLVPMPGIEFRRYIVDHFWDESYMNNWTERLYRILRIAADSYILTAGGERIWPVPNSPQRAAAVGPSFVKLWTEYTNVASKLGKEFTDFYERVITQQAADQKDAGYAYSLELGLSYEMAATMFPFMFVSQSDSSILAEQDRIRALFDAIVTKYPDVGRRFNAIRAYSKLACKQERDSIVQFTGRSKRAACVLNRTIPPLGLGAPPYDNDESVATVGFNLDELGLLLQSIDQFHREANLKHTLNEAHRYLDTETYGNSCSSIVKLIRPKDVDDPSAGFEWNRSATDLTTYGLPVRIIPDLRPKPAIGPSDGACSGCAGILDLDVVSTTRSYQWKQQIVSTVYKRLLDDPRYQLSVRLPERTRLYQLYLNLWWYNNVSARGVQLPSDFCAGIPTLLPPSTSSSSLPDGTSIGSYANGIVTVGPPVVQPIERVRPSRRSIRREFGGTKTGGHSSSHRSHRSRHSR